MKFISLFSGIGGLDLGLERAGMECVAQVEIDEFCQKVLTKHWPEVPKYGDIREVGKHNLPPADLVCGGFPCQDVSLAGKRKGLKGKRSTLWTEFYRVVCEIQPGWIVIENTPGLLSSDDGGFMRKILWQLSTSGYDAEWQTIPARVVNSPQNRERVFFVAHMQGASQERILEQGRGSRTQKQLRGLLSDPRRIDAKGWSHESKPRLVRVADGVPNRVDRLRALGNAVVPQVAEHIGRMIMELTQC